MRPQLTPQQQKIIDDIHALAIQATGRPIEHTPSAEVTPLAAAVINAGLVLLRLAKVPARSVRCYLHKLINEYAQNCPCTDCTGADAVRVNAPGGQG